MANLANQTLTDDSNAATTFWIKWCFITVAMVWLLPHGIMAMIGYFIVSIASPASTEFFSFENMSQLAASTFFTIEPEQNYAFLSIMYGFCIGLIAAVIIQVRLKQLFKLELLGSVYGMLFSRVAKYKIGRFGVHLLGYSILVSVTTLFTINSSDIVTVSQSKNVSSMDELMALHLAEKASTRVIDPDGRVIIGIARVKESEMQVAYIFNKKDLLQSK